ncbi:hypothetical protein PV325_012885, partial [Microctonus aethiopoides]
LEKENLEWLKNHLDGDAIITLKIWKSTFNARRSILHTGQTIQDYYKSFPCLRTALGAELLLWDFSQLHPGKENILFDRLECIRNHLIKRLKNCRNIKSIPDQAYVHLLDTLLIHNQDGIILYLLPYVIDPPKVTKKRMNNNVESSHDHKISIQEHRDSFLLHVESAVQIDASLQSLKENLRKAGLTLQPIPVFVGPLAAIEATYVAVDDVLYKVDSALHAWLRHKVEVRRVE